MPGAKASISDPSTKHQRRIGVLHDAVDDDVELDQVVGDGTVPLAEANHRSARIIEIRCIPPSAVLAMGRRPSGYRASSGQRPLGNRVLQCPDRRVVFPKASDCYAGCGRKVLAVSP